MCWKLKGLRSKLRLKQTDIAKLLNISIQAYSQKEVGKRNFTMEEMKKISEFLNLPVDDIFFE